MVPTESLRALEEARGGHQRNPRGANKNDPARDAAIAHAYQELGRSDVEIAREFSLSRERVSKIRRRLGVATRRCECGTRLAPKRTVCEACEKLAKRPKPSALCSAGCGRIARTDRYSGKCALCSRAQYHRERYRKPEPKAAQRKAQKKYLAKVKRDDPEKWARFREKARAARQAAYLQRKKAARKAAAASLALAARPC